MMLLGGSMVMQAVSTKLSKNSCNVPQELKLYVDLMHKPHHFSHEQTEEPSNTLFRRFGLLIGPITHKDASSNEVRGRFFVPFASHVLRFCTNAACGEVTTGEYKNVEACCADHRGRALTTGHEFGSRPVTAELEEFGGWRS